MPVTDQRHVAVCIAVVVTLRCSLEVLASFTILHRLSPRVFDDISLQICHDTVQYLLVKKKKLIR